MKQTPVISWRVVAMLRWDSRATFVSVKLVALAFVWLLAIGLSIEWVDRNLAFQLREL